MFSGVSGIKSHQTKMDVIGNNIANVNTTGFKSGRATFSDMISQTLSAASAPQGANRGGVNAKQIGLGVGVGSVDLLFTDGSIQSTGKNTDLALSGNGLFVVKQGTETYYTRNGAFEFDAEGNYVMPGNGMFVQGWTEQLNAAGLPVSSSEDKTVASINTNSDPGIINIKAGKTISPAVTTKTDYVGNLNADTVFGKSVTTTITVYDDQGYAYAVPIVFQKLDVSAAAAGTSAAPSTAATTPNTWSMGFIDPYAGATSVPATTTGWIMVSGTTTEVPLVSNTVNIYDPNWSGSPADDAANHIVATVSMTSVPIFTFGQNGSITLAASSMPQIEVVPSTSIRGSAVRTTTTTHVMVGVNLGDLTQYANETTLHGETDGWTSGTLKSVSIDSSGLITGTYTNGVRQYEGQVAVAQFTNASGLEKVGSSLYQASNNSGAANIKTATALGVTITASSLEMSNVDVANEFSEMIITQRGFQSNSKIVTVSDEMLETVINMKR